MTLSDWQASLLILGVLSNFIAVLGGMIKGIRALVDVRDNIRDLKKDVGTRTPPEGLLGNVEDIKHEVYRHRDSLIEITAELGLRRPGGRT